MGFSGESLALDLQMPSAVAWVSDYSGTLSLPAPTVFADNAYWSASASLPNLQVTGPTDFGWNAAMAVAMPTISTSGDSGRFASASVTISQIAAAARIQRSGGASISTPQLEVSAQAFRVIDWGSPTVTAPMPEISASIIKALAATYSALCLNARTLGVSEYTNYPFTSITAFNGSLYATGPSGIYQISGNDDAGTAIAATILGGQDDYGNTDPRYDVSSYQKRSSGIYFNLRGNGSMQVHVVVDENTERFYDVDLSADPDGIHQRRIQPGRLLEGRSWQFGIKNVSGADFTLRDYYNAPIVLSRRVQV